MHVFKWKLLHSPNSRYIFIKNVNLMMVTSAITILMAGPILANNVTGIETRDSSTTGYYLQLYNSINAYRAKHTIPALRWNRTLTESGEYFASRMLSAPNSFDIEEAEGLTLFITPGTIRPSASYVTGAWYNESMHYNFNNPGYNPATLNFTQMIWKSSTSVGIGTFTGHNYTSVVAKFYPVGNIKGKFRQNVIPRYKKI